MLKFKETLPDAFVLGSRWQTGPRRQLSESGLSYARYKHLPASDHHGLPHHLPTKGECLLPRDLHRHMDSGVVTTVCGILQRTTHM